MSHRLFICVFVALGLFVLPSAALADEASGSEDIFCTLDQERTCTGTTWGPLNTAGGHQCSWSGLTLKCIDQEVKYCKLSDGTTCPLQPTAENRRTVPGIYQVSDFVAQFVRVSQWALGFVVVLAVLMFVWAGWEFVTAGGRPHQVDEGKRIISGTITGLIISFAAFVIVNFAVYALTGTSVKTQEGGFLSVIFPSESSPIRRIFSGDNSSQETRTSCRSANNDTWDKGCSDHILCADAGESKDLTGDVAKLQKRLNEWGCQCGTVDGCFGPITTDCVRRFQVANSLPASGVADPATSAKLNQVSSYTCDDARFNADPVMSNLPKAVTPFTGTDQKKFDDSANGCCIISDGTDDLYCLENVSAMNCATLDGRGGNSFLTGKTCAGSNTGNRCGFCKSGNSFAAGADNNCFEFATPAWCASYSKDSVGDPLAFQASTCQFRCDGTCTTALMTKLR